MEDKTKTKEGESGPKIVTESNEKEEKKKIEQERTRLKKIDAVQNYAQCRGIIKVVAKSIDVNPKTLFEWIREDQEFAKALKAQSIDLNNEIKDVMLKKILYDEDGPMIRYYLDRKDPEFIPKAKTEIITGNRTLEDLLDEDENELNAPPKKEENKNGDNTNTTKEPGADNTTNQAGPEIPPGEIIQDTKQEGGTSAIPIQQGPGVLLEKEDEKKSDNKSETKGNLKSDRRGPTPRVHTERH